MSVARRVGAVVVIFAALVILAIYALSTFLLPQPEVIDFTSGHTAGAPVNLTVQTVGSIGFGYHPTWVSYLVRNQNGQWIHSTNWQVPAHTRINVTILQYDSGSPLRNQEWGQVQGTIGQTATLNGTPYSVYDSNSGNGVGHTFTVPSLGLSVPLVAIAGTATNTCPAAPCHPNFTHNTIKFSFTTPGAGEYPWQCFVPCGLGYLFGNGGPMSTAGYMGGFIDVVR